MEHNHDNYMPSIAHLSNNQLQKMTTPSSWLSGIPLLAGRGIE